MTIPDIALVTAIKGVCSEWLTFQITWKPTKHPKTKTIKCCIKLSGATVPRPSISKPPRPNIPIWVFVADLNASFSSSFCSSFEIFGKDFFGVAAAIAEAETAANKILSSVDSAQSGFAEFRKSVSALAQSNRGPFAKVIDNLKGMQTEINSLLGSGQPLQAYFQSLGDSLPAPGLYQTVLKEVEVPLINLTLSLCDGNQIKAAKLLGINRNTLRKKIKDYDLVVTRGKKLM